MRIGTVKPGFDAPDLVDDAQLSWPTKPRTGGLNITGKGKSLSLAGGDMNGWRVQGGGTFSKLEIKGLRGDFSKVPQDALPLNCKAMVLEISDCRFTGINGEQAGIHGDGIQLQDQSAFDLVSITNTTIYSCYQAIMHNTGARKIFLNRVNIRDEPAMRKQLSIALYLPNTTVILGDDVWIDWPSANHLAYFKGSTVIGSIKRGVPPGGDFCP